MYYCYLNTPIGRLLLVGSEKALVQIRFAHDPFKPPSTWQHNTEGKIQPLVQAAEQLQEYFAGQRQAFDVPLAAEGTYFQRQVWQQLQHIPYGQTQSYQQVAKAINKPKAVRALGAANGRNPIPIIIPCHRVIGANGKLTGYAGGLGIKQQLLTLEGGAK